MEIILILHIAGAVITASLVGGSIWKLLKRDSELRRIAQYLLVAFIYQIITGLFLLFQGANIGRVCVSAGLYTVIVAITEYSLVRRLQTVSNK